MVSTLLWIGAVMTCLDRKEGKMGRGEDDQDMVMLR